MSFTSRLRAPLPFLAATFLFLICNHTARAESASPKPPCNASVITGGYQMLPIVSSTATAQTYGATLPTWTPIDNRTECHIRQVLFNVPDTMCRGNCTANIFAVPNVFVQLLDKNGNPVKRPLSYNIQCTIQNGFIQYTVDAQDANELHGDFKISVRVNGPIKN